MTRLAVLASFNMDLVMRAERLPAPGETLQGDFAMFLGGKGFNQAIAARRLGAAVVVAGRVGDDEFGQAFLAALDREAIDRAAVVIDAGAGTGVASIVVDPSGENAIIQAPRANRAMTEADVARLDLRDVDAALLNLETSWEAAHAFARRARDAGALVVCNPAPAAPVSDELLTLCDVLVPNAIEAAALTGLAVGSRDEAIAAAQVLRRRGPGSVVVTLGEQGAAAVDGTTQLCLAPPGVRTVDTVGAGDAFCAALAVRLAERATLAEAVRFADAAGALATTVAGGEPAMPRRAAVDELLSRQR
jgi:ribokinase